MTADILVIQVLSASIDKYGLPLPAALTTDRDDDPGADDPTGPDHL